MTLIGSYFRIIAKKQFTKKMVLSPYYFRLSGNHPATLEYHSEGYGASVAGMKTLFVDMAEAPK